MQQKNLLRDTISLFLQGNWRIRSQMDNTVYLEKDKLGMPSWIAVTILILFGLLGFALVAIIKSMTGTQTIILNLKHEDLIEIDGNNIPKTININKSSQAYNIAQSPQGLGWGALFGIALASTIISSIILSSLSTSFY